MSAHRKLDAIAVEQIVADRASGGSFRQIAASLAVSHSTVSRRVRNDPALRARIAAAQKREMRRARDRERKARAKQRPPAATGHDSPPPRRQPGVDSSRPHGRRDQLRAARRILIYHRDAYDAREEALQTLVALLDATRSNGRPAYSLQLAAAKALLNNPARLEEYQPELKNAALGAAGPGHDPQTPPRIPLETSPLPSDPARYLQRIDHRAARLLHERVVRPGASGSARFPCSGCASIPSAAAERRADGW